MKTKIAAFFGLILITSCNYSEREQKLKDLSVQDSLLLQQVKAKDSSISAYIGTMNAIQDNLDSLKQRERIIAVKPSEHYGSNVIGDIRSIDNLIIKDDREIMQLQASIKKMKDKDGNLEKMLAHLHSEVAERDSNIVYLQKTLSQTNESMKTVVQQFNDSMISMDFERAENGSLHAQVNTVYYAIGTMKELKQKGVIDKEGGIAGIGCTPRLKQHFNAKYFTRADMTKLTEIPLYGKFAKVITDQPDNSFKVKATAKVDSLEITDPDSFWNGSKYLVVAVK